MRPISPHAAESGVGKRTARESERVQACVKGEERVTSAHTRKLAPEPSKAPGPFCFPKSTRRGSIDGASPLIPSP
jgi:hypothetical protein